MGRPSYIRLYETGELRERVKALRHILEDCVQCPRHCHVDRTRGELGVCRVGADPMVLSHGPHFGEERPLRHPDAPGRAAEGA